MFENILLQVATTSVSTQIVEMITAIGGIVVAVGAISHSLSMRPELAKYRDAFQGVADFSKDLGSHVIASKEEMQQLADVVYNSLGDKGQSIVNKQAIRLAELQKKFEDAQVQLGKIPPALDHI